jgi:phage FluMu protein Com
MKEFLLRIQGFIKIQCPRCKNVLGFFRKRNLNKQSFVLHCNCSHSINPLAQ